MEEKLVLDAEPREHTGSSFSKAVRKQGRIPVVVYGHKKEALSATVDAHDFSEGLHHGHRLMELKMGRKKETVLVKDLQYDHLGKNIIHADLIRVDVSERVTVSVPLELKGKAKGTEEGGIIAEHMDHLEIECMVSNIPESIVVSIKEIDVGGNLHAKDIALPEGVKLVTDPETLIVTCSVVAEEAAAEEVESEEPAAPEVIGKGKAEGEEEAGEEGKGKE